MEEKFDKYSSFSKRQMFLLDFENTSEFVEVKDKIALSRDKDDDKFLSLAVSAKATAIITGDDDLLVLHPFRNIPIVSPAGFLNSY